MSDHIIKVQKSVKQEVAFKAADKDLHSDYLHDESKITSKGFTYISFPETVEQLSAEHGIGSFKKEFLALQYDNVVFKEFFDPKGLINKGVFYVE